MKRRDLLKTFAAYAIAHWSSAMAPLAASDESKPGELQYLGKPLSFDYAWLKGRARAMAGQPYAVSENTIPHDCEAFAWDQFQAIRYRDEHALWRRDKLRFQVKFFHLGLYYLKQVRMHEV